MLGLRSVVVGVAVCTALCACAGNATEPAASHETSEAGAGAGAAENSAAGSGAAAGKGGGASSAGTGKGGAGNAGAGVTGTAGAAAGMGGAGNASSAGAGAGASSTTAGGSLPPPDPSVTFDWPATLPGGSDDCRPGHYTGTFSCEYRLAPTDVDPVVVVEGPIALTLERSQDGEFLEISDGQLEGIAQLVIGFRSQLSGKLDCATGQLTAAAVDGMYGFGDPAVLPFGTFAGTLTGKLDTTTGSLAGTWDLGVDPSAGGGACVGPWQANWAP